MRPQIRNAMQAVGVALGILLAPALFSPLGMTGILWLQTAPRSSVTLPASVIYPLVIYAVALPMVGFFVALTVPVATMRFHIQRKRRWSAICLSIWMMSWASWAVAIRERGWTSKPEALLRIADSAKPVTAALERYRTDNKRYTNSLQELVPAYLPTEPLPDAAGCAAYRYHVPSSSPVQPAKFRDYELKLEMPQGFVNWDCFVYWPEQEYPLKMYGGSVERIGDWAYVHE